MRGVDVFTDDGRVLHAYDVGPTGRLDELVVLWHHAPPISALLPSHSSSPRVPSGSAGSPMTDQVMEARLLIAMRPSPLRPLTLVRLPISWASNASPLSATLAAGHVPWTAELCSRTASVQWSACPPQRPGPSMDLTISRGCQMALHANFASTAWSRMMSLP
jgi:hypothetical protein